MTNGDFGGIFDTMRAVIDTNVLVSAARSRRGASNFLLQLIPDERFEVCVSLPLYLEYLDVLTRPEPISSGMTETLVINAVRYLTSQAHLQEIHFHWRPYLQDAKDDMVLELAVAAQAKRIVTFNLRDFRGVESFGIEAIKPRDFLIEIGEIR